MFFYKSPSTNIRDRVFYPVRTMCATVIKNDKMVLKMTDEILQIFDVVYNCIQS